MLDHFMFSFSLPHWSVVVAHLHPSLIQKYVFDKHEKNIYSTLTFFRKQLKPNEKHQKKHAKKSEGSEPNVKRFLDLARMA